MVMVSPGNESFLAAARAAKRALSVECDCAFAIVRDGAWQSTLKLVDIASDDSRRITTLAEQSTPMEAISWQVDKMLAKTGRTTELVFIEQKTGRDDYRREWVLIDSGSLCERVVHGSRLAEAYNPVI